MRLYILLIAIFFILVPHLLFADLIILNSGKELEVIIKEETEEEVNFLRKDGESTFSKKHIRLIVRHSDTENAELKNKWKTGPGKSGDIITCYDGVHRYIVYLPKGYNAQTAWP
jgi:hypothetical protein